MPPKQVKIGWISGMPRSGTTWLSQIFASSPDVRMKFCPLFSYEFKNALDEDSTPADWQQFFDDVYQTPSPYMDQEHLRKDGLIPSFQNGNTNPDFLMIKSNRYHHLVPHLVDAMPHAKVVYLVRHPAATLFSWLDNPTEFPPDANPLKQWRDGTCRKDGIGEFWGFDDWKIVTRQAMDLAHKFPDRFRIQRYEDLVLSPVTEARKLFAFFDLELNTPVLDFISASRERHDSSKRSVFKRPELSIAWKAGLPQEILTEMNRELAGSSLQDFAQESMEST